MGRPLLILAGIGFNFTKTSKEKQKVIYYKLQYFYDRWLYMPIKYSTPQFENTARCDMFTWKIYCECYMHTLKTSEHNLDPRIWYKSYKLSEANLKIKIKISIQLLIINGCSIEFYQLFFRIFEQPSVPLVKVLGQLR